MTHMEDVEAAVREHDLLPSPLPTLDFRPKLGQRRTLGTLGLVVVEEVAENLFPGEQRHADLLDLQPSGDIPERGSLAVIGSGGETQADHGEDHVTGAGD